MEPYLSIKASRAEEFEDALINYFAKPAFYSSICSAKTAVLIGGRGSGKTHVLRSLSFVDIANCKDKDKITSYWLDENYIGCYIKMDSYLVSSFKNRGLNDTEWQDIFAHYINLRLCLEIVKTFQIIQQIDICKINFNSALRRMSQVLCNFHINTLADAYNYLQNSIDVLLQFINNPKNKKQPSLTVNGYLLFEFCNALYKEPHFPDKNIFILIDEYESLYPYQQKVINTLLKKNEPPVVFKIAMRPYGWVTRDTLSPNQILQEPDDFDEINFENISSKDYEQLIKDIYKIRIKNLGIQDPSFYDVEMFLPTLSPEAEASDLFKNRIPSYPKAIEQLLSLRYENNKVQDLLEQLINTSNHIEGRLNLLLLERGMNPEELVYEYQNRTSKYIDWYHNYHIGILFLLCRESRARKKYTGFSTYCLLSSKIIRNFVIIFNRSLELARDENFKIELPKPFSFKTQDKAAYETSMSLVFEIQALPVHGQDIFMFTNYAGRLLEGIQKEPRQSEPEQSHFYINSGTFSDNKAKELFEYAIHWSILQEVNATKLKSPNDIRGKDYMLNRIYSPYYQITYRKKRKLSLSAADMQTILIGSKEERDRVISRLRKIPPIQSESNITQLEFEFTECERTEHE